MMELATMKKRQEKVEQKMVRIYKEDLTGVLMFY